MSKLRGIIVGTGKAGTELHYPNFVKAGADIVAYVDIDLARAKQAAQESGIAGAYGSLGEALAVAKPDFVSICTTPSTHYELARQALNAGVHVLIEKPITETVTEALEIKALADQKGKYLSVVHNFRFLPGIMEAQGICQRGELGEILHVERHMHFRHDNVRMMEPEHWAHKIPGGRLFEANPHNLYIAYQFVGATELISIEASKRMSRWPHAKIDGFTALLRGTQGQTLNISMGVRHETVDPRFMLIFGTKGTLLVYDHKCYQFETLTRSLSPAKIGVKTIIKALISKGKQEIRKIVGQRKQNAAPTASAFVSNTGHRQVIDAFVGYLNGRYSAPVISWEEIIVTQKLNQEMGEAVERGVL